MSSFFYGKNTDLLPLYGKYKRKDDVNGSLNIILNHGNSGAYIPSIVMVNK